MLWEKGKVEQDRGELECQVKEGLRLAILSRVVRVVFIETTVQQIPKEGEGVIHSSDYERNRLTLPIKCVDHKNL